MKDLIPTKVNANSEVITPDYKLFDKHRHEHPPTIVLAEVFDVEWEDVDPYDHPDYCDAFISSATYKGRDMTEEERDWLMDQHSEWCFEDMMESLR